MMWRYFLNYKYHCHIILKWCHMCQLKNWT
jgi:hypothetical protein